MNIALIGMMGCGKTTVGKLLSEQLNLKFVDTDELIVQKEGCSINEIFASKGEVYFRELETKVLKSVLNFDNQVISTGGGIIKSELNMELIKTKSKSFYLKADAQSLFERVKNDFSRPLLKDCTKEKIDTILSQRVLQYEKADYIINTVNKTPENTVKEVIEKIK